MVHPRGSARRRRPRGRAARRRRGDDATRGRRGAVMAAPPVRYLDRLGARIRSTGTQLCLGIDIEPGAVPSGHPADLKGVASFAGLVLEAAGPYAAAVKVN